MGVQFFITLAVLFLGTCHLEAFSIKSRHERSVDMTEALAILQRQRRRAASDYLGANRLLNRGPFNVEDEGEWMGGSNHDNGGFRNDLDTDWVSNGQFVEFEPQYDIGVDNNRVSGPVYVEPSKQELENIFDDDDDDENASNRIVDLSLPEKKKKEEMVNVKGDGKIVQKKSIPLEAAEAVVATSSKDANSNEGLSLDTLTKEEFHALMKAVDKLQKQAVKFSEQTIETPDAKVTTVEAVGSNGQPKAVTIVQPASKEELKAVFEGEDEPVVKETDVIVERGPNSAAERVIKQQVMSNLSPRKVKELKEKEMDLINVIASELEDNIAEDEEKAAEEADNLDIDNLNAGNRDIVGIERDWLARKYESPLQKRTTKRSASYLPLRGKDVDIDDVAGDISTQNDDVIDDLDVDVVPESLDRFVDKILELQDEVDNLKIVSQLEDLENDVLTDALNEATLAQKEGSVTDMEFESLQQAIRIEEALQKLKNSQGGKIHQVEVIKRGEPWRRKREPDVESNMIVEDNLPSYSLIPSSAIAIKPNTNNDDEALLDDSSLRDINEQDTEVASFFMSNADECPGVQEYSTNCELADFYSLPVDFEARSLCNLHEMCYACGNSLKVGQEQCDLVYRAAASALCRGKQNCVLESEIFLRTMKLKNRYIPHTQPMCRSNCVAEFLGML